MRPTTTSATYTESRSASTSHNNNQLKSVKNDAQFYMNSNKNQQQQQQQQQQQHIEGDDNGVDNRVIHANDTGGNNNNGGEAVVTPELLVDALSGHEDGLLAIAERLMEHYEAGYDVMGEAIIDAFADVQKLFQHVVEAAHMEGAAFEASRMEAEGNASSNKNGIEYEAPPVNTSPASPGAPMRHDEFVDDDVRAILTEAGRLGHGKKEAGQYLECYEIYEEACNSASASLPVDSDHRGRLQLSIARAESMSPERACAILKYAMDDVLRSGKNIRPHNPLEKSKRSDCVLKKPPPSASPLECTAVQISQSNEEVLASLVQEMKEVSSAPMYEDSAIQEVAARFWDALADVQKQSSKNEERLEQSLGKLKADFLLARAEWEEKLSESTQAADAYQKRCYAMQDMIQDQNNTMSQSMHSSPPALTTRSMDYTEHNNNTTYNNNAAPRQTPSVVSIGSGIAQHAKSLVGSFSCGMGGSSSSDRDKTSPTHPMQQDNQHVPGVSFTNSNDSNSRNSANMKQFMYHQASI